MNFKEAENFLEEGQRRVCRECERCGGRKLIRKVNFQSQISVGRLRPDVPTYEIVVCCSDCGHERTIRFSPKER